MRVFIVLTNVVPDRVRVFGALEWVCQNDRVWVRAIRAQNTSGTCANTCRSIVIRIPSSKKGANM